LFLMKSYNKDLFFNNSRGISKENRKENNN
jgi:hypothetical protein